MAKWKLSGGAIATTAAVAAILLGIVDSMQTRAHNRLSVAPYLVVDYNSIAQPGRSTYRIDVSNEGVGPAIIESMAIRMPEPLGGGKYRTWDVPAELLRRRGAAIPSYWNYEGGEALGVQRNRQLIEIIVQGEQRDQMMQLLSQIDVEITYRSIYRQEYKARLQ
jgi:hypothetical protein